MSPDIAARKWVNCSQKISLWANCSQKISPLYATVSNFLTGVRKLLITPTTLSSFSVLGHCHVSIHHIANSTGRINYSLFDSPLLVALGSQNGWSVNIKVPMLQPLRNVPPFSSTIKHADRAHPWVTFADALQQWRHPAICLEAWWHGKNTHCLSSKFMSTKVARILNKQMQWILFNSVIFNDSWDTMFIHFNFITAELPTWRDDQNENPNQNGQCTEWNTMSIQAAMTVVNVACFLNTVWLSCSQSTFIRFDRQHEHTTFKQRWCNSDEKMPHSSAACHRCTLSPVLSELVLPLCSTETKQNMFCEKHRIAQWSLIAGDLWMQWSKQWKNTWQNPPTSKPSSATTKHNLVQINQFPTAAVFKSISATAMIHECLCILVSLCFFMPWSRGHACERRCWKFGDESCSMEKFGFIWIACEQSIKLSWVELWAIWSSLWANCSHVSNVEQFAYEQFACEEFAHKLLCCEQITSRLLFLTVGQPAQLFSVRWVATPDIASVQMTEASECSERGRAARGDVMCASVVVLCDRMVHTPQMHCHACLKGASFQSMTFINDQRLLPLNACNSDDSRIRRVPNVWVSQRITQTLAIFYFATRRTEKSYAGCPTVKNKSQLAICSQQSDLWANCSQANCLWAICSQMWANCSQIEPLNSTRLTQLN